MSEFINHVLKNKNEKITSLFGPREFYLNNKLINDHHNGIDLIDKTSKYDYIIAYDDGVVVDIRDTIKSFDEKNAAGNYIEIKHDEDLSTRYHHIAYGTIRVRVGDIVKKGDILGYIGGTGYVTGAHLHFAIKKNGQFVNPINYLNNSLKKYLGEPVDRNELNDQIEVIIDNLRVRDNPNGSILGYIKPGIYDFFDMKNDNGYDWYKIDNNKWIAYREDWANIYKKNVKEPVSEKDQYEFIYECLSDNIYALKLYKGEKLYVKK